MSKCTHCDKEINIYQDSYHLVEQTDDVYQLACSDCYAKPKENIMQDQSVDGVKLHHMFERLTQLTKCITGKMHYDSSVDPDGPPWKDRSNYYLEESKSDYVKEAILTERAKQIHSGVAVLKTTVVSIIMKKPQSTIASLYKYKAKAISDASKKAHAKFDEIQAEWEVTKTRRQQMADVMSGYVYETANKIKDAVASEEISIAMLPSILDQFEMTQGGTAGHIMYEKDGKLEKF